MPDLSFLPFAITVFIAITVPMTIEQILKRRQLGDMPDEDAGPPFAVLEMALAFDPDHAIIWETQVPAIRLVADAGRHGIDLRRLHQWYLEFACHYPELYDGSSFMAWVNFLEQERLIVRLGRRVMVTTEGIDFLHYRVAAPLMVVSRLGDGEKDDWQFPERLAA